nr:hypothetical protein GCM10025699_73830 [Microbacterium flavescens]
MFVIEGTVTYDPLQFDQLEVTASTGGMPIRSVPDVNGTFTLTIPAEFAGRQIGVQAHLGNKSSAVDTIDLLETRPNTASDTHPLAILSPWAGAELAEPAVTFSGVAIPNSQIVVTNDAETDQRFATLCETNVLANGKWTCDSPRLPDGEYSATVTEKPTWSSVTEQTEGSSFSIVHGDWKPAAPALPHLSSITDSGDHLIVRVVIPGASRASLEVGEHRDEQQGINGRFSFWVEKSLAGQTATVAGLVDQSVGKALDIPLTPIADTITPAPLTAPVIHHVADEGGHVYLEGTTGYAPFEFFTPGVIAKKDGKLIGSTELTYNGAFILRLDEEYVGDEIELFSTRNLELSTATELVVAETEKNSAPETFPLEVTSPADGATVPATSPTFTGEGIPGAKVRVEDTTAADKAPVLVCGADVLADGTWSCEAEKPLAHGEHTTTVTEAPFWVSAGTPTTTRGFTIGDADSDDEAPIVVTTPADGSTFLAGSDVTFTGTATPGADIALHLGYGLAPVIGTADAEGDWSVSRWLGNAPYTATVIQSKNGKQLSGAHTGPTITPAS